MTDWDKVEADRMAGLSEAVDRMAETFARMHTADDVAIRFACSEIETLVDVLHAAGHDAEADAWLNAHLRDDEWIEAREGHGIDKDEKDPTYDPTYDED